MPARAAARASIASAPGQIIPDMPTGAMPKGRGRVRPIRFTDRSGATSPCRIEGIRITSSSIIRLRALVASTPVPLSRYSQTKRGMRARARARRSLRAGYCACRSMPRICAGFQGLVQCRDGRGTIPEHLFISDTPRAIVARMSTFDESDAFEGASLAARAMAARPSRYLDDLNPAQRQAVETLEGPLLMLAGAGTGKTKALMARIAHLLSTGTARPNEILAVTFTNKAAREMKMRVSQILGETVEGMPWLGTFHAINAKLLRRHAELAGLKPNFTILDTDDQLRLLKQVIALKNIDEKRWPARQLAGLIDRWKNRAWTPQSVPAAEASAYNHRGTELYDAYQTRLRELNAVDFGDLLLQMVVVFQRHEDVLAQYQRWFRYILVDEYQDTNVAQYLWLRLLAAGHRNICCVGDDDQSIYGWRGAEVGNILRFEKDFPGATVVRLEQNYRSTPHILAAASGVIAANESRLGKTLWTDMPEGEKLRLIGHWDGEEEARWVGEEIEAFSRGTRGLDPV